MADTAFQTELEALFEDAPSMGDEMRFAAAVEQRLRRHLVWRRCALAGASLVAAVLAFPGLRHLGDGDRSTAFLESVGRLTAQLWTDPMAPAVWTAAGLVGAVVVALHRNRRSGLLS